MNTIRLHHILFSLLGCSLILLLTACGSSSPTIAAGSPPTSRGNHPSTTGVTATVSSGGAPGTPASSTGTGTTPMPTTLTTCPSTGTARAAVMAGLALGSHPNIVYIVNEFPTSSSSIGTLKRYDVTTGNKTEIIKFPNVNITEAQLSANGQWILFVANVSGQYKLQMIRMDGQGLQTLYCGSSITAVQWSTNQKLVVFNTTIGNAAGTYLLNLVSGTLQLELKAHASGAPLNIQNFAIPLTWLDNTRLYVSYSTQPIAPISSIGLLDTSRGANQQFSNLIPVFQQNLNSTHNYPCWDADSSYDASTLFVSQCGGISAPNCSGSCSLGTREGPSSISTQPATSNTQHTILSNATLGINTLRAVSAQTLLLVVENFSENHPSNTSQNGLWKVGVNGTGLTRLTTTGAGVQVSLNPFTQFPWSNVSRDGSLYTYATYTHASGSSEPNYALFFGSLGGGTPTTFASISDGTQLQITGWTTM